jgi:membrane fusion protein
MAGARTAPYRLFRSEALRAYELDWQGRRALALGLPAAFTSISAIALAAAAVALITLGGYSRRVDMEGTVLPSIGVIEITASSPGRVETLTVQEGQAGKKGEPLYAVDLDTTTKDGGVQQQIIDTQTAERDMLAMQIERKTRMSEDTEKELQQKIETLKTQITQVGEQITFQQTLVQKVSNEYSRFVSLVERASINERITSRQQTWASPAELQDLRAVSCG